MGQQPNIPLGVEDLPRPTAHPAPARRWRPARPGELAGPDDVPWGGAFGTPGPDAGYALRILAGRHREAPPGEDRHDIAAAVAALMVARASRFGRAPVAEDAATAEVILGLDREGLPAEAVERLAAYRRRALPGIGHAPARLRSLVRSVDVAVLEAGSTAARAAMAAGERLIDS